MVLAQSEATWLDSRKRLPSLEAARKKPGWVWTAYPTMGYDPNRGFGAAIQANISYNGPREDSLFLSLPYRHFGSVQVGFFQREVWYGRLGYEWLWLGGRPYRLMMRTEARQDGQIQLWGKDASTLTYALHPYAADGRFSTYYHALKTPTVDTSGVLRTREAYHRVRMTRVQVWLLGERLFAHGLLRLSMGLRYLYEKPTSLFDAPFRIGSQTARQAPTLFDSLAQQNLPFPLLPAGARLFLGAALIWDTRDFEVDPHKGLLLEASQEIAPARLIYKTTLDLRAYLLLYEKPQTLPRLTLAVRALLYGTYGRDVPLWDIYYANSWADARRLDGLSGPNLLRSYRENRFIAPFGQVYQAELRLMLLEKNVLRQNFISGFIAFTDVATGANTPFAWYYPWKASIGLGGRILWNLQTILRADAAYGSDGWQLIFTTRHTF
jgi:hypothetical protein